MTIAEFPALLDKARALADQFALSASHYDETGNFPRVNFDQLFQADLLRLVSARENGGSAAASPKHRRSSRRSLAVNRRRL